MRKKILLAVLFLPMFVCAQWQYLGNPNFIDGNITFRSMDVHQGTPYIAFNDLSVMKFDGMNWTNVGSPEFISNVSNEDDGGVYIKIHPNGEPHIAFINSNTGGGSPVVMKFNGTDWVNLNSNIINESDWFAFDIDQQGNLYMAYAVDDLSVINIAMYNGVYWEVLESIIDPEVVEGDGFSLKISTNNIVYLIRSFYLGGGYDQLRLYKLQDQSWQVLSDYSCQECFLPEELRNTFAVGENPYLVFPIDVNNKYETLEVLEYNQETNAWDNLDFPTLQELEWPFSISVNNNGTPYILYTDESQCGDDYSTVYKLNNGSWELVGNPCFQAVSALSSALVFDNGIPYSLSEESEASVMWLPSKSASNTEEIESVTKNGPKLITNLFGQETTITKNSVLFYIYEGGFVEKRIIFD